MAIEFQVYPGHYCCTGDKVYLAKQAWDCIKSCNIVGLTLVDNQPVVDSPTGPVLNDGHLILGGILKTPGKPGQVPIEVSTLGQYEKISPTGLKERKITAIDFNSWSMVIVTEDFGYVKLVPTREYDDGVEMQQDDITMRDLQTLGCLDDGVYETYEQQCVDARKTNAETHGEQQLNQAVVALGLEKVLGIVREMSNKES
jgi:hypothetical protein